MSLSEEIIALGEKVRALEPPDPAPLVKGLATRSWIEPDMPWHPEVKWKEIQPEPFGPVDTGLVVDRIGASQARLRLMCGAYAPDWLKNMTGSVGLVEPQGGAQAPVVRWWTDISLVAYADLQRKLAWALDGWLPAITLSGAMTFYAEPMIRQVADPVNRENLLAAGYTIDKDLAAQARVAEVHRDYWKQTRAILSVNPYQGVQSTGQVYHSASTTISLMEDARSVLGDRVILQNNSLRSGVQSEAYEKVYEGMVLLGKPISFQTSALMRVGDLQYTLEKAIGFGAHLVELPSGYRSVLTDERITTYDDWLRSRG